MLEPAQDRNRRLLPSRFVSPRLRDATTRYLDACDATQRAVVDRLQALCDAIGPSMPTVVTAAHYALISTTLASHVRHALAAGWSLPELKPAADADRALALEGVWPYWLERAHATPNTLSWDGLWLLTGPNMAGKSSLMRSMLAAALLANCGLMAPLAAGRVPRYDAFFLRTASFDAPAEGKSAFAQEMEDVHVMASECGASSLVLLDEVGRGTSTSEGSALCAALLEWLDERRIPAVFATHLHEIDTRLETLPPLTTLSRMCLPASASADGRVEMSFTLEEGVCRTSLALHTARAAGLPPEMLARAEGLLAAELAAAADADDGAVATATTAEGEGAAAGDVVGVTGGGAAGAPELGGVLSTAAEVLRMLSGADELVHVEPDWMPPPRLSGRSCVYLLHLGSAHGAATDEADRGATGGAQGGSLYVGESDAIDRRLQQHRRKNADRTLRCVLVEVESKSAARELEELTIRKLKEMDVAHVRNVANA